ncbi:MAG: DUF4399 domain-containing protein [Roseitalea sp.]|jgi:hypothetical protein|nr:DUF4399 domain-containing protein [Roseitalea sp.]MBO6722730.1 DUF4399 domain-containing protein [Roseitalea sp.]MBO6744505.1 DUF4399 domain-containing protein [Roseitalea sp.]
MRTILAATAALFISLSTAVLAQGTPSPDGAEVYIVNLDDGGAVQSPVTIVFGMRGMGVAPAGVEMEGTGHHHLFVNRAPFGEADAAINIPADDNHIHFGGGQTEVTLELPAGEHTLQLVAGDHNHIPHDPPIVSDVITITVE